MFSLCEGGPESKGKPQASTPRGRTRRKSKQEAGKEEKAHQVEPGGHCILVERTLAEPVRGRSL